MLEDTFVQFVLLAGAGAVAGIINTLAGGGSAITIPLLMLYGLPGDVANATNRVSVFTQSAAGSISFFKADKFENTQLWPITLLTIIGAILGAVVATYIPNDVFEPMILGAMIAVAILIAKQPKFGVLESAQLELFKKPNAIIFMVACGFYGGFLQAGVGYMLLAVLCGQLRYDLARANAIKVFVVVVYTIPALAIFASSNLIDWFIAIPLIVGTTSGAWVGARYAINVEPEKLRKVLLVCVVAMCGVLILRH